MTKPTNPTTDSGESLFLYPRRSSCCLIASLTRFIANDLFIKIEIFIYIGTHKECTEFLHNIL